MEHFSYRKLRVYEESQNLVLFVYTLLKLFPKEEYYALCDQLRRAVISIPSNIAEGMGRSSLKEQITTAENYYRNIAQMLSGLRRRRIEAIQRHS